MTEPSRTTSASDEGRELRDSTYSRQFVTGRHLAADPWAGIVEEHGSADLEALSVALPEAVLRTGADASGDPVVGIDPAKVIEVLECLRDDAGFTMLTDLTAADYPEEDDRFVVVYILTRVKDGATIRIKAALPEENPEIPSAVPAFASANWLERETFDMFGIRFANHPDLRRILMPDDYPAHPLRKEFPMAGDVVMRIEMAETETVPQDQRTPVEFVTRDEDLAGETMVLNMGPSHPSTHGVLRIILELDGEKILYEEPDIGYLHRGMEKIGENFTYNKFVPYTDRLDYLAPMANNVGYINAVEKCLGVTIPPRAQALRVMVSEMARISSHLLGLGCFAMDVGAMTVFLWTFQEREYLYTLFEKLCGARFTTSYTRVGGLSHDMKPGFADELRSWLAGVVKTIDEVDKLLTRNKIWLDRTQDVGVISKEDALSFGLTGANLRASGVEWDIRKTRPYLGYENYDFDVPIGTKGDCYDRYLLRIEEMRQSVRILHQVLDTMPDGPFNVEDPRVSLAKKDGVLSSMEDLIRQFMVVTEGTKGREGDAWFSQENPKGELGFYVVSDGSGTAYRLRIRSPSFASLSILSKLLPGHMVPDTVAILGSFDFVMGDCDR